MSILIRKKCQESLDNLGLNTLHADVHNKFLTIVGPCGQTVVSISGIKFATKNPNRDEVTYAAKLFKTFVENNKEDILNYAKAKAAFNKLEKPIYTGYLKSNYSGRNFEIKVDDVYYYFHDNGKTRVEFEIIGSPDFASISKKFHKLQEDFAPYLKLVIAYDEASAKVEKLKAIVNRCDI